MQLRLRSSVAIFAGIVVAASAAAQPSLNFGSTGLDPADFRVTTFASGLAYPYGMVELPDGSILAATSKPNAGGNYFVSSGELVRFVDADDDGVAESSSVLASNLPGTLTGLTGAGDLIITASVNGLPTAGDPDPVITVLRRGATPADALSVVGSISFDHPANWGHVPTALATRPTPGQAGSHDLFFQVGSKGDGTATTDTVNSTGLLNATYNADSIYKVTLTDTGTAVTAGSATQIATGLRNAAGLAFHPTTGDLYFEDNGFDSPIQSADELNMIAANDLGGAIEDFGFAGNYFTYPDGVEVGSGGIDPLALFLPLGGANSEGPAEIAFAPDAFPTPLAGGLFIGFHGDFNSAGTANDENPLVFYNPDTDEYFHFIETDEAGIGHLDGLLATGDSLYLADLGTASLFSGAATGAIYQITYIPEPTGALIWLVGMGLTLRHRRS